MNGSYLAYPGEGGGLSNNNNNSNNPGGGQTPDSSAQSDPYSSSTNLPQHSFLGDSLYAAYNPQLSTFASGNDHHSLYLPAHHHLNDTVTLAALNQQLHNNYTTSLQQQQQQHHNALKDYHSSSYLSNFAAASPLDSYYNNLQQHRQSTLLSSLAPQESDLSPELDPLLFMTGLFSSSATDTHLNNHKPTPQLAQSASGEEDLYASMTATVLEPWLDDLLIPCTELAMEPLRGSEVVQRVQLCVKDILTRYIPCVDFLVECQQSLRKGLVVATRRATGKRYYQEAMTPVQFLATFVEPLPGQFYAKTEQTMEPGALADALRELHTLVGDARNCTRQGSEAVKNSFLGGMKDGESWGLRKWLSRHGNALRICTDLECLLVACKKLERTLESTRKLARLLRPMAQRTLSKLKNDIPASYQEVSAAHPYLPFFHRLEGALRNMSLFDPEEDAVICIDDDSDDDDDEIEVYQEPPPRARKRKQEIVMDDTPNSPPRKEAKTGQQQEERRTISVRVQEHDDSSSGESEEDSVVEIVDVKPASQSAPIQKHVPVSRSPSDSTANWPIPIDEKFAKSLADTMANSLELLAVAMDEDNEELELPRIFDRETFWNPTRFASALRLFALLLRQPESVHFVDNVNEDVLVDSGHRLFSHVVKHPLCFRDIQAALIQNEDSGSYVPQTNNGKLLSPSQWNMWKGSEFLQAIDLVLLNALAYGQALGEGKSPHRSKVNKLRKTLWNGIHSIMQAECDSATRRRCTPTRRSEDSGFVVYKIQER